MKILELFGYILAAFAGIYTLAGIIFLSIGIITQRSEFKNYFALAFFNFLYIAGTILFIKDIPQAFKANFLFPIQCTFAGWAFYYYLRALSRRFYLRDKVISYLRYFFVTSNLISLLAALSYLYLDAPIYFEESEAYGNYFIAASMGSWHPLPSASVFMIFVFLHVLFANIYLLYKLAPLKLSSFHRLIPLGIFLNLGTNLNDNLMGTGLVSWNFPLLYFGYIFEVVYFLILSLRNYNDSNFSLNVNKSNPQSLSTLESGWRGLVDRALMQKQEDANGDKCVCLRNAFLFAVDSMKTSYNRLSVTVEANLQPNLEVDRKEDDLAVILYHLVWDIFDNIESSPTLRGHISAQVRNESGLELVLTENSPSNCYLPNFEGRPDLENALLRKTDRLRRIVDGFNAQLFVESTNRENIYRLKL